MDRLFWITAAINFVCAIPLFWLMNLLSRRLGQVPNDAALVHHGRRYAVWWEETTLVLGDGVCLCLMDGAFVSGFVHMGVPEGPRLWWALGTIIVVIAIFFWWYRGAVRMYANHDSWGWHWCGPTPTQISAAGVYHTVYFVVQMTIAMMGVLFLIWQPGIRWDTIGFFLAGGGGYLISVQHTRMIQERMNALYHRAHR